MPEPAGSMQNREKRTDSMAEQNHKKKVIQLIGGVGAGKSRILELLKEHHGAEIIQTDLTARKLEEKGQPGYLGILESFGTEILEEDGELDRKKLANLIFSDEMALKRINELIHPMVWQWIHDRVKTSDSPLIVVESAIPDKNPGDIYNEVWYVYTLRETRLARLMENRGYSREKSLQMMANQLSEEEYEQAADRVIDNNGPLEEAAAQIEGFLAAGKEF